jgi:SIR2-like domain
MLLDQFPFGEVAGWLAEGKVVPFLGAGASIAGGSSPKLPDGRALATELIRRMEQGYPGQPTDDLAKVAEYFEKSVFDRSALFDFLHTRFYVEQLRAPLARVAQFLAALPNLDNKPRFIVTTNYDSFVERAFHKGDRPLCVITQNMRDPQHGASQVSLRLPEGSVEQEEALLFQWNDDARFPAGTTYLFKMHGSADRKVGNNRDDLIITESDYVDFLVNSGGPVSPLFPPVSLLSAFSRRRFLFLGYSLEDWNFRAFLHLLTLRSAVSTEGLRHWAIQLHPNELDVQLWGKRNVNVFDADLLQFCDRLDAAWASEHAP